MIIRCSEVEINFFINFIDYIVRDLHFCRSLHKVLSGFTVVQVGRLFRADDVVVKVRNSTLTLSVVAQRTEGLEDKQERSIARSGGTGHHRLSAMVTWEFQLPATVDVNTLTAGLTVDGLLRVSARLTSEPSRRLSSPSAAVNSTV